MVVDLLRWGQPVEQYGHDFLIAFSCKGRGVCPSCNARRMAETAAHLDEQVFPPLPVRQWALSVPKQLRYFLQHEPATVSAVLHIFLRVIEAQLRARPPNGYEPMVQDCCRGFDGRQLPFRQARARVTVSHVRAAVPDGRRSAGSQTPAVVERQLDHERGHFIAELARRASMVHAEMAGLLARRRSFRRVQLQRRFSTLNFRVRPI